MMTRRTALIAVATTLLLVGCHAASTRQRATDDRRAPVVSSSAIVEVESLAVAVTASENRAVSYTNKRAAYYYTQTHRNDHPEHAYFRGFNLAGRRIFSDYRLRSGGKLLDPGTAAVIVRPDVLIRRYPQGITETL